MIVPDDGPLPVISLPGGLRLTLLGPNLGRLHALCTVWSDVLGGDEDTEADAPADLPADILGRSHTWPPAWKDGEKLDPSVTNGSSITRLAEYAGLALLLAGDALSAEKVKKDESLRKGEIRVTLDPAKFADPRIRKAYQIARQRETTNL